MAANGKLLSGPSWMTREYFVDAIAAKLHLPADDFTVGDIDPQLATEAGDNFASVLYRVHVPVTLADTGTPRSHSLIVKALPTLGLSEELIQLLNVFPKEIEMYSKVLPAFEQLYRERNRPVTFGPRCLKHSVKPTDIIVLEDLTEQRYRMANRRQGLDLVHCRALLDRLAQFHAASAVHHELHGPYGTMFKDGIYSEKGRPMFEQFQQSQGDFLYNVMSKWPNGKFYADVMKTWGMDIVDALIGITKLKPGQFAVMNHGDMWCNNIMFLYDDKNAIKELKMLDFQGCFWGSPVMDLLYFFISSINGDIRLETMNYLLRYYHGELVRNLAFLGYRQPMPTLKDLNVDFVEYSMYGFITATSILPVCLMEKTEGASLDLMLDEGEAGAAFKRKMYNNPAYVKQIVPLLEHFYNLGTFDVNHRGIQKPSLLEYDPKLQLPPWMGRLFFESVVEQQSRYRYMTPGGFTLRKVKVELAGKKGDNFASVLYRARIQVLVKENSTIETVPIIIKTPLKGKSAEMLEGFDIFTKELQLYETYIPAYEQMYRDKGVEVQFAPKYMGKCRGQPKDVIVLEDMSFKGYSLGNRLEGLDQRQTEQMLNLIAQFHAASAVHYENGGHLTKDIVDFSKSEVIAKALNAHFAPAIQKLLEYMKAWDYTAEYMADLEAVSSDLYEVAIKAVAVDPNGFNVVNHGDTWVNNMMFANGNDTPGSTTVPPILLDYQMCYWASPVIDLQYFLFTSVRPDLKLSKLNYFIRFYHERLVDHLIILDYRKALPTLHQLHIEFNDRLIFGLMTVLSPLPYVLATPSDDAAMEATIGDNEASQRFQRAMYDNDLLKSQLKMLLPFFRDRGVLTTDVSKGRPIRLTQ